MGDSRIPIIIIIETKSIEISSKILYNADQIRESSVTKLSNLDLAINPLKFEDLIGERQFQKFEIVTFSSEDLQYISTLMDGKTLSSDCDVMKCISGNPANETTEGIIHFYKDEKRALCDQKGALSTRMLAMIGVPRSMSIRDILAFIAPCKDYICEMKVVKDSTPNEYIILLRFLSDVDAHNFYNGFNNVPFNSLESNVCRLVYISHVECVATSTVMRFPLLDVTELPTCPVCLERLDEPLNGILTIVCNHTFHSDCIQKMNEPTCPVCRYPQTPQIMSDKYQCSECDLRENLWLCLICANIGCGRHEEHKHAERHFTVTGHPFAIKIGSRNLVWDYASDCHVHRLVANSADGKPVHVEEGDDPDDKKAADICLQYSGLLADQLATQRAYLESEFCERLSVLEAELATRESELTESRLRVAVAAKDKLTGDKRINQMQSTLQKTQCEYEEEKMMNKALLQKQEHLSKDITSKDDELKNLQEQLRDLMLNLEMSSHIAEAQGRGELNEEDINGATVSIVPGASSNHPRGKKSRRK